jgi:hypothetical protein
MQESTMLMLMLMLMLMKQKLESSHLVPPVGRFFF